MLEAVFILSVIIPAYNEELTVERAYREVTSVLKKADIENEIIFIDDGSTDLTYEKIRKMAGSAGNLLGLHFSRNFGKEAAISAGLASATGDCAVVIDCDLQHPPEKIVEMYRLWQQGFEIVEGKKRSRGEEGKFHSLAARMFYITISRVVGCDMSNASDFKLLDRKVIDILNCIPERKGFFRAISYWVGFNKAAVEFTPNERCDGASKWSTKSLIRYAISSISAYSTKPMQLVTVLGAMMLVLTIIFGFMVLFDKAHEKISDSIKAVMIITGFVGSIVMISLGIIGHYVARIYEEIKGRPKYVISSSCGKKKNTSG